MLFRPLEAKYLFGRRLPFTPGLIPKERNRLAARTGLAVKEYLLTEEAVWLHLESADLLGKLQTGIRNFLDREAQKDTRIGQVLADRLNITPESLAPALARFFAEKKWFGWAEPAVAEARIQSYVARKLSDHETWLDPLFEKAKEAITRAMAEGSLDQTAAKAVLSFAEKRADLTVEASLPEPLLLGLLAQYNEREDDIVALAKKLLLSPRVTATVRAAAQDTAEQHMARPLRMFLRPEGIGSRVAEAYSAYVESEDSTTLLKENLRGAVETLLQTRVGDIVTPVREEKAVLWARELLEGGVLLLHREGVKDGLYRILEKNEGLLSDTVSAWAGEFLAESLGKLTEEQTVKIIEPVLVKLFETKTADVIKSFGEDASTALSVRSTDLVRTLLPGIIRDGVARFGVDALVEEQIKRFDVKMLEEVIVDVADRELRAITWLGALLGAIMGLIQPLLQRFL